MVIKNPGLVLPIILIVMLAGIGFCLYILFRAFRGKDQPKTKKVKSSGQPVSHHIKKIGQWLAEPAQSGKGPSQKILPQQSVQPAVSQRTPPSGIAPPFSESVEVMRVLRIGAKGSLVVQAGGTQYHQLSDITDAVAHRRVAIAIQELGNWLMSPELEPGTEKTQTRSQPSSESTGRPDQNKQPLVQEPSIPSNTFISQIESLLQQRLALHPTLKDRYIHITESAVGDLQIKVDETEYSVIDDIPDKEIAQFLRDTLNIWERS